MSVTRRLRRPQPGPGAQGSSASGLKMLSWTSSRQTASNSKGCFRAPSGLTDSEDSDNGGNESPRYSFMAPSGYTGQWPRYQNHACECGQPHLALQSDSPTGDLQTPAAMETRSQAGLLQPSGRCEPLHRLRGRPPTGVRSPDNSCRYSALSHMTSTFVVVSGSMSVPQGISALCQVLASLEIAATLRSLPYSLPPVHSSE